MIKVIGINRDKNKPYVCFFDSKSVESISQVTDEYFEYSYGVRTEIRMGSGRQIFMREHVEDVISIIESNVLNESERAEREIDSIFWLGKVFYISDV